MIGNHTKEPWHANHAIDLPTHLPMGSSSVNAVVLSFNISVLVADDCYPEDAERIVACVNFCAGITNKELQMMHNLSETLLLLKTQVEQTGSLLLDVRDDSVAQIRLLKEIVEGSYKSQTPDFLHVFNKKIEAAYDYLKAQGVLK